MEKEVADGFRVTRAEGADICFLVACSVVCCQSVSLGKELSLRTGRMLEGG